MSREMEGVSEETTTGVKRLYEMQVCTVFERATPSLQASCFYSCYHQRGPPGSA
jgi:S-adenosylhomocysteine hydrolase